jgi:monoamine oxidase
VVGWATGNYARRLIALGEEQGIALGVRSLRAALDRPDLTPIHARMTHWNDDLYTLGAYSYAPPHGENAFAALAQPIAGTVFFAGEATDALWHSTVHGAYRSGARAAKAVTTALGKRG